MMDDPHFNKRPDELIKKFSEEAAKFTFLGSFAAEPEIPKVEVMISESLTITIQESKRSFDARNEARLQAMYANFKHTVQSLRNLDNESGAI